MKLLIKMVFVNVVFIFIFFFIYLYLNSEFENITFQKKNRFLDFFLLSTTIQAGVGLTDLMPVGNYAMIATIIQQIIKIFTHVITIYVFIV
jgi:hypothetical protein